MKINATFSENAQTFATEFVEEEKGFASNFGEIQKVTEYIGGELYDGDYVVTPKVDSQTIPTKGKVMAEDVTVNSIPFFNVSNNSGGSTVYIAKEI